MRRIAAFLLPVLTLAAQPLAAQEIAYGAVGEQAAPADGDAIADSGSAPGLDSDAGPAADADVETGGARLVAVEPMPPPQGVAAYGPFRVLDATHAALVGVTDAGSPGAFAAMLHDYPDITMIEMAACPGTEDDRANLRLGLMIRGRGMATHVPAGGFVGSGAVELFLAGVHRYVEPTAEFAVHSWEDESGREAKDYAPDAPENRAYLDYYRAVGMSAPAAQAFYAMTNSVPFAGAKYMSRADMAAWVRLDSATPALDSAPALQ